MLMVVRATMVSYVIKEVVCGRRDILEVWLLMFIPQDNLPCVLISAKYHSLLQNWHSLSWLLRWCYSFFFVISLSLHAVTSPSS